MSPVDPGVPALHTEVCLTWLEACTWPLPHLGTREATLPPPLWSSDPPWAAPCTPGSPWSEALLQTWRWRDHAGPHQTTPPTPDPPITMLEATSPTITTSNTSTMVALGGASMFQQYVCTSSPGLLLYSPLVTGGQAGLELEYTAKEKQT